MDNSTGSSNSTYDIIVEPLWSIYVYAVANIIVMILAVTGNGVILIVEQFNKQKTSTDWLVTFMSGYDIVLAGCNIPIYILYVNGKFSK